MHLRGSRRWWRLGFSTLTLIVTVGILTTRWSAIFASHPAYLWTLLIVAAAAIVIGATGLFRVRRAPTPATDRPARPWRRTVLSGLEIVGFIVVIAALIYLRPLTASSVAIDAMSGGRGVSVRDSTTRIELHPTGAEHATGLVFYPGALVDPRAYVPNLTPLAAAGYPVTILKVPYNIAFLDRSGADKVMDAAPRVTRWAVGGHSLGGVVASSVAGGNDRRVRGLLLWASYPNTSIADKTSVRVTSISGSRDGLATPAKINASKSKLPPDTRYVVIKGGVHSFFGDYGEQSGDGTPSISRDAAQRQIQAASLALMRRIDALAT